MNFSQKNTSALAGRERRDGALEIADGDEHEALDGPALRSGVHDGHQMRSRPRAADRVAGAVELGDRAKPRGRGHVDAPDQRRVRVQAHDLERDAVG